MSGAGKEQAGGAERSGTSFGLVVALVAAGAWAAVIALLGVLRHLAFHSNAYDLGLQQHVTWNTSQGRWFEYTYMLAFPPHLTNHLGDHVNLILLPIAALYRIHDGPETLIVVQAILVASGLIPLFLVGRERLGGEVPALLLAGLYLLHPATQAAALFDFHPIVLAAPLFVWAYWLAHARRPVWLAVVAALMLSTQENAALVVAMLGVVLLVEGLRKPGAALLLAGLAWFVTCFFLLLPAWNPRGSNAFSRYRHLGASWLDVAAGLATDPGILLERLFGAEGRAYLRGLLLPFGYTSLLAPEVLLGAASELALNLLSSFAPQRSIEFHYASVPVAVAALAAVVGTARLAGWLARFAALRVPVVATGLGVFALLASLEMQRRDHGAPRAFAADLAAGYAYSSARARAGREIVRDVPPGVPISAQGSVAPHLSRRPVVYVFPTVREAEWVVLDTGGNRFPVDLQRLPGLGTEESYREYTRRLLEEEGFRVETARAGWLVLRRAGPAAKRAEAGESGERAAEAREAEPPPAGSRARFAVKGPAARTEAAPPGALRPR